MRLMSKTDSVAVRVRNNQPLLLLVGVVPAAAGAAAAGAVALLTSEIWQMAVKLSAVQLIAANFLSILAMVVWLIIAHELWIRTSDRSDHAETRRENTATVLTVLTGVIAMYAAVFFISIVAESIVLQRDVLSSSIKQPADWRIYAVIAWLASSIATVGGAIGSGLESDENVRAAVRGGREASDDDRGSDG